MSGHCRRFACVVATLRRAGWEQVEIFSCPRSPSCGSANISKLNIMHDSETVRLGVVGAHLRGLPLNHQLLELGAQFAEQTVTAPEYRFYALPGTTPPKPGLVLTLQNGGSIEIEIWNEFHQLWPFCGGSAISAGDRNVKLASGSSSS